MPDPPYTTHDDSVFLSYPRCLRRLAFSSLLTAFAFPFATLHGQSFEPGKTAGPTVLPELQLELDQTRARFEARLAAGEVSPEQRAILIEAWLSGDAALQKSVEQERQNHAKAMPETAVRAFIPHTPIPPGATPLQSDIIGMENEILDFRNSLGEIPLTPEQRAIQVEAFLDINKEALRELEGMKRMHSAEFQGLPEENQGTSAPSEAVAPTGVHPISESSAKLAGLRLIQAEASELDPEARTAYIESKIETINRLQLVIASVRNIEISAETVPTNTKPPSK